MAEQRGIGCIHVGLLGFSRVITAMEKTDEFIDCFSTTLLISIGYLTPFQEPTSRPLKLTAHFTPLSCFLISLFSSEKYGKLVDVLPACWFRYGVQHSFRTRRRPFWARRWQEKRNGACHVHLWRLSH